MTAELETVPMTAGTGAAPPPSVEIDEPSPGRIRAEAIRLRDAAAERARDAAESGKARATDALDGVARMAHDAAVRLGEQTSPQLEDYAERAATALDEFSQSLRAKSIDEIAGDVRDFAKRSPAVAIGAAVAVGFALTRFAKASAPVPGAGGYRGIQSGSRRTAKRSA